VRLRPNLTDDQRRSTIALVRKAVAMPQWRLRNHGTYTVTGAPVVVADLSTSLRDSIVLLLVAALVVMAATLLLVFRTPRARLLPLGIALAAAGLTFGGMALVGAPLTMATIAVLPVLIGLAVDYAIQLQSRWDEIRARERGDVVDTAARVGAVGAPTILTRPSPPRSASSSCSCRRCRWCEASGSYSSPASCSPSRAR
jgi:predicted RND superfamily exporter protein